MTKMTKAMKFDAIAKALVGANVEFEEFDAQVFLAHEIELLAKKGGKKSPTKTQKANAELLPKVVDAILAVGHPATVTEVIATGLVGDISNQKGSALIKKLVDDGTVVKTPEKGKSLFSVANNN